MKKIDITSSVIEKGLDIAKNFLDKLIGPSIEETGLLLKDKIAFWRYKNQIRMLNKAKSICEANNISSKNISLKILSPILEYASLEEDEELLDKWAILLSNMVDSEQNIENHVFPHILSQISISEFKLIQIAVIQRIKERKSLKVELEKYREDTKSERKELEQKITEINKKYNSSSKIKDYKNSYIIRSELNAYKKKIREIDFKEKQYLFDIEKAPILLDTEFKDFEISNLIRLGIVKLVSNQYAYVENGNLSFSPYDNSIDLDDLDIRLELDYEEYFITQLGEMFINVCTEKNSL